MPDRRSRRKVPAILLALALAASGAFADSMPGAVRDNTQRTDCRMWVKRFDPFRLEWPVEERGATVRCVASVEDGGKARKGAKVVLTAGLVDESGKMVAPVTRRARTDDSGRAVFEFSLPGYQQGLTVRARVDGRYRSWKKATVVSTDCGPATP